MNNENNNRRGGFASMSPERRREIASLGGKSANKNGKARRFTRDEAVAAGRKGGIAFREKYFNKQKEGNLTSVDEKAA